MRSHTAPLTLAFLFCLPMILGGQEPGPGSAPLRAPTDADIRQAITAIETADGYRDLLAAATRHDGALRSPRMVELIDARLQSATLDNDQRGLLMLERQLSLDSQRRGATVAARLLSVRLIAGLALLADTPEQLAAVLEKFAPLASEMNAQLVRDALNTPGNSWPPPLLPLMEQLARDWPALGASAAARRMAEAASQSSGQAGSGPAPTTPPPTGPATPATGGRPTLVGHWLSTRIVFESPRDEHLVLQSDGTAETWVVTASGREPVTRGHWSSQATALRVDWADGRQWGQPFTFYEGQLVFPNVQGQRQFWERVD